MAAPQAGAAGAAPSAAAAPAAPAAACHHRWPRDSAPSLLLLLALGVLAAAAPLVRAQAPLAPRFQKPYNVCTSDWSPIVTCADLADPADYTGFQVELWRQVAADLGLAPEDWTFSCVDWTAMIDDLTSPTGNCSFAAAGVEVSLTNIVLGLKFSWPIYKNGLHLLIASAVEEGGIWGFAQAFHWSVWVTLGATAVAVSVVITAAELLAGGDRGGRKGLRGWSWYCMSKMVQVTPHVGDPRTWASRVLVLGWAFLVVIMVHLFTATTASKLTMQRLANDISDKADLPGKAVESWEPYIPLLRKYSIDATAMPWDNDVDMEAMLDNLRTHKYQALVLDSPVVQYFAARAEACDLYAIGEPFETFNLAIAFPPDVPDALPASVSASIVRLQTGRALLDTLENTYIKGAGGGQGCHEAAEEGAGGHSASTRITLRQVLGLWYILLMTLGAALVIIAGEALARSTTVRQVLVALLTCRWWRVAPALQQRQQGSPGAAAARRSTGGSADTPPPGWLMADGDVRVMAGAAAAAKHGKAGSEQHQQQQVGGSGGNTRGAPVLPGAAATASQAGGAYDSGSPE